MHVAQSGEAHHQAGGRRVVLGLENDHAIMRPHRPEQVLHFAAALLRRRAESRGPVRGLVHVREALLREVQESDIGVHGVGKGSRPLQRPRRRPRLSRDGARVGGSWPVVAGRQ